VFFGAGTLFQPRWKSQFRQRKRFSRPRNLLVTRYARHVSRDGDRKISRTRARHIGLSGACYRHDLTMRDISPLRDTKDASVRDVRDVRLLQHGTLQRVFSGRRIRDPRLMREYADPSTSALAIILISRIKEKRRVSPSGRVPDKRDKLFAILVDSSRATLPSPSLAQNGGSASIDATPSVSSDQTNCAAARYRCHKIYRRGYRSCFR